MELIITIKLDQELVEILKGLLMGKASKSALEKIGQKMLEDAQTMEVGEIPDRIVSEVRSAGLEWRMSEDIWYRIFEEGQVKRVVQQAGRIGYSWLGHSIVIADSRTETDGPGYLQLRIVFRDKNGKELSYQSIEVTRVEPK